VQKIVSLRARRVVKGTDKQIQIVTPPRKRGSVNLNFLIAVYLSHLPDFLTISKILRDINDFFDIPVHGP
jgi:hypothetical protein